MAQQQQRPSGGGGENWSAYNFVPFGIHANNNSMNNGMNQTASEAAVNVNNMNNPNNPGAPYGQMVFAAVPNLGQPQQQQQQGRPMSVMMVPASNFIQNNPVPNGSQQQMMPMMVMTPQPPPMMHGEDMMRPASVAFSSPTASSYPFVNFQWPPPASHMQPDVTTPLFAPLRPPNHPDLVNTSASTRTLTAEDDDRQPCYANDNNSQPTYMNNDEAMAAKEDEQPSYMNNEAVERQRRLNRGNSLPPQINPDQWTPKAPPRSRRGSRRGSMSSLSGVANLQPIDPGNLNEKLKKLSDSTTSLSKDTHPVHVGPNAPKRPSRRKDFFRKSVIRSGTLPRDFKGLTSIAEDLPQVTKVR